MGITLKSVRICGFDGSTLARQYGWNQTLPYSGFFKEEGVLKKLSKFYSIIIFSKPNIFP
jgi:hypothetical protein